MQVAGNTAKVCVDFVLWFTPSIRQGSVVGKVVSTTQQYHVMAVLRAAISSIVIQEQLCVQTSPGCVCSHFGQKPLQVQGMVLGVYGCGRGALDNLFQGVCQALL